MMMMISSWVVTTSIMCLLSGLIAIFFYLYRDRRRSRCNSDISHRSRSKKIIYGFFHPYASGGGGGERVLWKIIQFLQKSQHYRLRQRQRNQKGDKTYNENNKNKNNHDHENGEDDVVEIFIYTIDPPSTNEADLRLDAERRFDVKIPQPVRLVSLEQYKEYLLPRSFLSLVMESWGTMKLARQALLIQQQQQQQQYAEEEKQQQQESEFIFCDTTGCAFTFLVVRLMCISTTTRILAYVHYPTISIDMMFWEWQKSNNDNNNNASIKKRIKTIIKLIYYYLFSLMYGLCGSLADLVLVNSTWTYNHINSLWRFGGCGIFPIQTRQQPICIVYPPCRVPSTVDDDNNNKQLGPGLGPPRENTIISIGQFRPEKNHKLQIQALFMLLKNHPELRKTTTKSATTMTDRVQLLLIGSCRNDADQGRVDDLRRLVEELNLQDYVVFSINPPYQELQASMMKASFGIHTMRQEHFGIGIVEMMAVGLLVIAHDSGGPKTDIIQVDDPKNRIAGTGFLATTQEEYAEAIYKALTMDRKNSQDMRRRAQASATRFSDDTFDKSFEQVLPLLYS